MKLGNFFGIMDGSKLWNEFISYMSLVSDMEPKTLNNAVYEMWYAEADSMRLAFPFSPFILWKQALNFQVL